MKVSRERDLPELVRRRPAKNREMARVLVGVREQDWHCPALLAVDPREFDLTGRHLNFAKFVTRLMKNYPFCPPFINEFIDPRKLIVL